MFVHKWKSIKNLSNNYLFLIIYFLMSNSPTGLGNMASPVEEGTKGSSVFLNQHVNILREQIRIELFEDFQEAKYNIEYQINVRKSGVQIPIIFQAKEYKYGFEIHIDGKKIEPQNIPPKYIAEVSKLQDFDYLNDGNLEVTIWWTETDGIVENLSNLKYFEVDLKKGLHTIEVAYVATPWIDKSNWIKEYSFRYSLSPAKYWNTFEELEVEIDAKKFEDDFTTNLGLPQEGYKNQLQKWRFNRIPQNTIEIKYVPSVGKLAEVGMFIGPFGIALILGGLMIALHLIGMKRSRLKSKPIYSLLLIAGSILIPLLLLLIWICAHSLIDEIIGKEASKYHGYTFMIFLLYPVLLVTYSLLTWSLDANWKGKHYRNYVMTQLNISEAIGIKSNLNPGSSKSGDLDET